MKTLHTNALAGKAGIYSIMLTVFLLIGFSNFSAAQNYNMSNTTISTCAGTFYDSGGGILPYGNNQNLLEHFCPSTPGLCMHLNFTSFSTETNFDFLWIFDGPDTCSRLIGMYTGTASPGNVQASSSNPTGCLTVRFRSDNTNTSSGWAATISCGACAAPPAPTTQDCLGAIPICQNVYSNPVSYSGTGNYPGEINQTQSCLFVYGERNDVWYSFTVQASGNLAFDITPVNLADDYDWEVMNLTNANCQDIYCNPALDVSCNYSSNPGVTGPDGGSGLNWQNNFGSRFNATIPVLAGQTYVINVSNFSSTQSGYTIDFSASTASIFDNIPPTLQSLASTPACGGTSITINFSENVQCNSVQASDFTLTGPGGPYTVTAVSSAACASGATYDNSWTLTISPAMGTAGNYNLNLVNNVSDICGNIQNAGTLPFTIAGVTATASMTPVTCLNGTNGIAWATITSGTGPFTYTWTPSGGTNATASNLAAGTYTVTTSASSGCPAISTVTITQPLTGVSATATHTNNLCSTGNTGTALGAGAGGTGPYTYHWSPSGGNAASASNLSSGIFTVTVTDAGGCTDTAMVTITSPPAINLVMGVANGSCSVPTGTAWVTASNGTGPYGYSWTPSGGTNSTASNLTAGTYSVTVTDANGCTAVNGIAVTASGTLTLTNYQVNLSCNGSNDGIAGVSITGGTAPFSYTWAPSVGATATVSNLSAGNYTVTATDGTGCSNTANFTITQPPALVLAMSTTPTNCGQSVGTAGVSAGGGTGPYTYSWTSAPVQTTATASNLAGATYTVTVTDAGGCTGTGNITVTVAGGPTPSISAFTNVTCNGLTDGTATATAVGGTGPYTYSWSTVPVQNTANATNLGVGTYTVTVTDAGGCTAMTNTAITAPAVIVLTVTGTTTICNGQSTTISASAVGGTGPYNFAWSNAFNGASQSVTPGATTTYTCTVTDANGCTVPSQSVTVTIGGPLSVSIAGLNSICVGDNTTLTATGSGGNGGPYIYTWTPGGPGNTINVSPGATTTYNVSVSDGCTQPNATSSITVTVVTSVNVQFTFTPAIGCSPLNVQFTDNSVAPAGSTYAWNFGGFRNSTAQNPTYTFADTGSYTVSLTITTPSGCTGISIQPNAVTVTGPPTAMFSSTPLIVTSIMNEVTFTNLSINANSYTWDFGDNSPFSTDTNVIHRYPVIGDYMVYLIASNGPNCSDTADVLIRVKEDFTFYVPSAFTPDGNGINDHFFGTGTGIKEYTMNIFDRWGNALFISNDLSIPWDGKYKGLDAKEDIYVYNIYVKDYNDRAHYFLGKVSLIR